MFYDNPPAERTVILAALHRCPQRSVTACDIALYDLRRNPKGRNTFCCIQNAQPSGGSRPDINQMSSLFEAAANHLYGVHNLRQRFFYCFGNFSVLYIDQFQNFQGCAFINVFRPLISFFSFKLFITLLHSSSLLAFRRFLLSDMCPLQLLHVFFEVMPDVCGI